MAAKRRKIPGEEFLSRRAGSPHWHIDITLDGRRLRESAGTASKEDAAALAVKLREDLWREVKLGERPKVEMTVTEAFARYYTEVCKGTRYGERSQRYNLVVLRKALGADAPLSSLTDDRVSHLAQGFRARLSPATVNRYITTLSVVCKRARDVWGVQVGTWSKSKHTLAEPQGRETFLDYDQAIRLLDALCGHARPIVLFDLMTGLRLGNVLGLTWEQISMDLGRAVLIQKGGRPLAVTLVHDALVVLAEVEPVFERRRGKVWRFGNPNVPCGCSHCLNVCNQGKPVLSIKRAFATAVRAAGLTDVRFHDLRHTFASWLLADTPDLKLVQEALGHTRIETTARYAHLLPGRKEKAISGAVAGLFNAREEKKEAG